MGSSDKLILLPYQRRWVNDRSAMKIWLAARQIGKSFAVAMEAVDEARAEKCDNLILSSSERQSKEVMKKVSSHLRVLNVLSADSLDASRENREEVELLNGSRIISLPASPDTVRGFSGNVYLDEFAFHQDSREIWRAMYPTVTRGYKVRITSTPNGRLNMFYELYNADARFSRHRTNIHDAVADGLCVDIPLLRDGIGDPQSWAQEFECEFVDEATALITLDEIASCEGDCGQLKDTTGELYLGVDIGRSHDLTVIWILERVGDVLWTRGVRELRNASFSSQRETLFSLIESPAVKRCCMDSTGIGAQLSEEARERFGTRVEPVQFTLQSKEDLAVTARRAFEDRTVRIPQDATIRRDIHSVRRYTTSAGNARFDASRTTEHADRFWALALALHAAKSPALTQPQYEQISTRQAAMHRAGCW